MTAYDVIQEAYDEQGVCESPANSNNVKYNTWYYNRKVSGSLYPWCAVFISWLFRNTNLIKKSASCLEILNWCEKNNLIVKNPKPGDLVFFKFNTNNRRTNHIGIVFRVEGNKITTIEGNTSMKSDDNGGKVMMRTRTTNIVAYARPKYDPPRQIKVEGHSYTEVRAKLLGEKEEPVFVKPNKVMKDNTAIAKEVIAGKWGNGETRKKKLTEAGYNYEDIRKLVNKLLKR